MARSGRIIVVGGGLAAARAVESARGAGYEGELVVIADEPRRPYERPPLSKGYLLGTDASSAVYPLDARWYREHRVEVRTGVSATSVHVDAHTVEAGGEVLGYDRLLLATGSSARRFAGPGAGLRGIHHLRRLPDATALRRALRPGGRRVVLVGGGWIGLEVAAAAREYGNEVTVVARGVPLAGAIGEHLGRSFQAMHEEHGVVFRRPAAVTAVRGESGRVAAAVLGTGEHLPADLVVFGIGATPNTQLAASAGLELREGGIATDAGFATSAPDVFAAGDVAATWNDRLGRHLRVDHWANADSGGRLAGRALAGETVRSGEIPYFFTDQYDLGMEYSGYGELAAGAELVIRGDLAAREYVAFWLADGRVVAGMNVNVWDVNAAVQRLIRSERIVSRDELADPTVPLDALAGDVA
ncbi:NAD(P)/FAD-dependent oxidoreductase [Agromyces sp. CFH 90414]|uniref:NAD(P)/FAD-dependent oxidoreductase n=1 Tax=Agromyces agglutinans TaxID=2662258 RepID=A0A6I2F870_9MICO|nr:FAD-dependent oxidoreductase [Agromyces agglutinans]MRG61012.1 NAD(P)/FAD-dependent oxidoreductase [Agromyces agglutinans]